MSPTPSDADAISPLRAAIPAWLLSLILHFSVLTAGVLFYKVAPRGVEEPGRGVGIVLTQTSSSGQAEYFEDAGEGGSAAAGGSPLSGSPADASPQNSVPLPGAEQLPQSSGPALPKGLPNVGLPGEDEGLPGAGGLT